MDEPQTHSRNREDEASRFARIEDAHERIEVVLDALGDALRIPRKRASAEPRGLLRWIERELRGQHDVEERSLYAHLDRTDPRIRAALDEHRHLERLLDELSVLDDRTPAWAQRAWSLKWSAELHFRHEEDDVFEIARGSPGPHDQGGVMLRSLKELKGYGIRALDGDVGKVDDFLFDDVGWFVRYVVVGTGGWLSRRKVLVSPEAFDPAGWPEQAVPVRLTKQRIEDSPALEDKAPVSRREEERLRSYYGWTSWWHSPMQGMTPVPSREVIEPQAREAAVGTEEVDPHLRSAGEVMGYHLEAKDGEIGHVDDFIVDDHGWALRYLVAETRNLLPGKKVLLAPQWITGVRWTDRRAVLDLTKQEIKDAPEFDATAPVNRVYEERVYDYYGRPKYW